MLRGTMSHVTTPRKSWKWYNTLVVERDQGFVKVVGSSSGTRVTVSEDEGGKGIGDRRRLDERQRHLNRKDV